MQDPFIDPSDDLMTRATDLPSRDAATASAPPTTPAKHVCPFCGAINEKNNQPCPRCTMEDTAQTRAATKNRIGPWYVLQKRNPAAPGMKWGTLLSLVAKGQVTERSIVRGPTTHQLWRVAAQVKGLSREFGLCYSCGGQIERTANQCPHCDKIQEPPVNPDALLEGRESLPRSRASQMAPAAGAIEAPGALPQPAQADLSLRRSNEVRPASEAGILSAKELAAAFQLDFQPAPEAPASTKRSILRTMVLLVFLAVLGGIIFLYLRPEYRGPVQAWFDQRFDSVKTYVSDGAGGSTPPAMGAADPVDEEFAPVDAPVAPPPAVTTQVAPAPAPPIDRAPTPRQSEAPPRIPDPTPPAPAVEDAPIQPPPTVTIGPAPRPIETPSAPAPVEQPTPREPSPPAAVAERPADAEPAERPAPRTPAPDPARQARELRLKALEAQAQGDWRQALKHWEAIQKLPKEVHFTDLELKINIARERVER